MHYRIEGKELTATNQIVVRQLDVQRAGDTKRSERLVGIPLGLAVALLKNSHGVIELTVPVSGRLDAPHFSFGNAIRTAFKNVIGRLISAPFRAIGSVLRRRGTVERVAIEPITFSAGSAALTPEATAHLRDVAQAIVTRIRRLQRQDGLADFGEAAQRLWSSVDGRSPAPNSPQKIVQALAERAPAPIDAARGLAERRLEATRTELVRLGVDPTRVQRADGAPPVVPAADGSVEFEMHSAS